MIQQAKNINNCRDLAVSLWLVARNGLSRNFPGQGDFEDGFKKGPYKALKSLIRPSWAVYGPLGPYKAPMGLMKA